MKNKRSAIIAWAACLSSVSVAGDTLKPYASEVVPTNVIDLWSDVDASREPLETQVVKQWIEDGIVCRYVIFKVGTFKGADSRIAALYTFPEGMKNGPAFVWSHGGGQRAERVRGEYFARRGYATLDINWGGREIVNDIQPNTDWGNVDPSQGPMFYPKARRPHVKLNLEPDEYTIDPIPSPRNGNWFLLALAGRRAITFLQQQPEVDPEKIGFTGYSMGGTITSMVAIDPRVKTAVPMVGGSGFIMDDFPGLPRSGKSISYRHADLFSRTIDSQAYWPHVKCPVLFLSASNDFHAVFDNVYRSMSLLPHKDWRTSHKMHYNHSLGAEQWILLDKWFDKYLKGESVELAETPESSVEPDVAGGIVRFRVTPDMASSASSVKIYYSHDPNPRTRFWKTASTKTDGATWKAILEIRDDLPLYVFANCEYPLGSPSDTFQGTAESYSITSQEHVLLPKKVDVSRLRAGEFNSVFEDFAEHGFGDWGFNQGGGLTTYKLQDSDTPIPAQNQALQISLECPSANLNIRLRIQKDQFHFGNDKEKGSYSAARNVATPGQHKLIFRREEFKDSDQLSMTDWENTSTLVLSVYDSLAKRNLDFTKPKNQMILQSIKWVEP